MVGDRRDIADMHAVPITEDKLAWVAMGHTVEAADISIIGQNGNWIKCSIRLQSDL